MSPARKRPVPRAVLPTEPVIAGIQASTLHIVVVRKRGLGTPPIEHDVAWPAAWRLPAAGETIHVNREFGGFVEYLDWDLGNGVVRVMLR